ncbi:MAG: precorrin-2 C(20)-methyltransferase [Synergistaceae bacterium]|jgi:precorrin-2/cobalt-factor-2 C20-methyltransferase|nr:precorrin-2 C(20)-methyltransferase [Synergistaceae bacterium]
MITGAANASVGRRRKIIAVGVGPGDPDLITVKALKVIERADLVLVPVTSAGSSSVADAVIRAHLEVETVPVVFPMTRDEKTRRDSLRQQLEALRPRWESSESVALPVIGDSALYATAAYLYGVWKRLEPSIQLELVPGVSAHSLAGARAGRFLALGEEIFSVVPGTARPDAILQVLKSCDSAAIYKPTALQDNLRAMVQSAGPWSEVLRVDRGGLPGETILRGDAALSAPDTYLSTLLLRR